MELFAKCLLFPIADVQIDGKQVFSGAANGQKQSLSMAANVTATNTFLWCEHKDEQEQYDASYCV